MLFDYCTCPKMITFAPTTLEAREMKDSRCCIHFLKAKHTLSNGMKMLAVGGNFSFS